MLPPKNTYIPKPKPTKPVARVQDKAIKRFQVRNMVDASSQRDLREASYLDEKKTSESSRNEGWNMTTGAPQVIL